MVCLRKIPWITPCPPPCLGNEYYRVLTLWWSEENIFVTVARVCVVINIAISMLCRLLPDSNCHFPPLINEHSWTSHIALHTH